MDLNKCLLGSESAEDILLVHRISALCKQRICIVIFRICGM